MAVGKIPPDSIDEIWEFGTFSVDRSTRKHQCRFCGNQEPNRQITMKALTLSLLLTGFTFAADWPHWRGPTFNNHAATAAKPVTEWSTEKNVRWQTDLPGLGHSTPIVVGDQIYLTTGDEKAGTQSLVTIDRKSGQILWTNIINKGGLPKGIHKENTHASQTPVWDGEHVITLFHNRGRLQLTAVKANGDIAWDKVIGDFLPDRDFGYGSTPAYHKGLIYITSDYEPKGYLVAIETKTGEEKWRTDRNTMASWSTPVVGHVAGKDQLLSSGQLKVTSQDPLTGKLLWEAPHISKSTCGTVVWNKDSVFASGGYPKNQTAAYAADGSGKLLWQNKERTYEQSMLVHGNELYTVTDKGFAFCWDAETGEEHWSQRLGRGGVMASPTFANGLIFAPIKNGQTTVFKATPEKFEQIAQNQLGDDTYASPVFIGDELYMRVGFRTEGNRREVLYCLAE